MRINHLRPAIVVGLATIFLASTITLAAARGPGGAPHGFSQGNKMGWGTGHVPPGWSHGRKTGWGGHSMPPGLR